VTRSNNAHFLDWALFVLNQSSSTDPAIDSRMGPFVYRCPNTEYYVQGWTKAEGRNLLSYETVACPVCQHSHLVNVKTGRVAGSNRQEKAGPADTQ
jgi:hypothetical protein